MTTFVSYSHQDAAFVDRLAARLFKAKINVWVDRWELNVGDSILERIEESIGAADALVVILSKASVESHWCRKEITAGLLRELEEKNALVLPVLVEDCEIPLFVRDKKYADFRGDFEKGFQALRDALARVSADSQGRVAGPESFTDWSTEWAVDDAGRVVLMVFAVEQAKGKPYTTLSIMNLRLNELASDRHIELAENGFDAYARSLALSSLAEPPVLDDLFIRIEDSDPVRQRVMIGDPDAGLQFELSAECRRLGTDVGRDVLLNLGNQIRGIARQGERELPREPAHRMVELRRIMRKYRQSLPPEDRFVG